MSPWLSRHDQISCHGLTRCAHPLQAPGGAVPVTYEDILEMRAKVDELMLRVPDLMLLQKVKEGEREGKRERGKK